MTLRPPGQRRGRRVPYVAQMEMAECGAACLAMVLGTHGHHVPLPEVRRACGVSRDGASALAVVRAAKEYGLQASGRKVEDPTVLAVLPLPAVLHWDFNHFVVLERIDARDATIVDPRFGRARIDTRELGERFTGVALVFEPGLDFQPRKEQRPSLARYRALLAGLLPNLGQVLLASLALQLLALAAPLATQFLVDRVIAPRQESWLWALAAALAVAGIARLALGLVRNWVLQGLQNALDASLMSRFLDHLLHLSLSFFLRREAGDLVERVQANAMLRTLFGSQSISALLDALTLGAYLLLMLAMYWPLGLLLLGFAFIRVFQLLALRRQTRRFMTSELSGAGREEAALVSALSGLELTRAIGAERHVVGRWQAEMVHATNSRMQRRQLDIAASQAMGVLRAFVTAAVLWLGGMAVMSQEMTLGVFAAFVTLQSLFLAPLDSFVSAAMELQLVGTHLRRMDDVLETPVESSGDNDPGRLRGGVELDGVSYRHDAHSPPVLDNVSIRIEAGEKVAIVGRSGAGKSTLARLLLGMHAPDAGYVRFDGRDLSSLSLRALRRQVGVVLQEPFLFDESVRANLSLHDPTMPLVQMQEAAALACIDDVIEALPQGYETRVGENGGRLSGGQRQRLCLARALAHRPAILLLDEATSALDLGTEARVHANLAALKCTRIVIAHRLGTVMDADRILMLEGGRVVQQGRYDELAADEGPFRQFVESLDGALGHA